MNDKDLEYYIDLECSELYSEIHKRKNILSERYMLPMNVVDDIFNCGMHAGAMKENIVNTFKNKVYRNELLGLTF